MAMIISVCHIATHSFKRASNAPFMISRSNWSWHVFALIKNYLLRWFSEMLIIGWCPWMCFEEFRTNGCIMFHCVYNAHCYGVSRVDCECRTVDVTNYRAGVESLLGLLPFFHIYGLAVTLLNGLASGAKIVTMPKFEPQHFLGHIQKYKVIFHQMHRSFTFMFIGT